MLFTFFKCPVCGHPNFAPDFDLTIDSYCKNEFNNEHMLVIPTKEPLVRPNYLIFKCSDLKCTGQERITEEDILKRIIDEWAKLAWNKSQSEIKNSVGIDGQFTKYVLEGNLHKFISEKDKEHNAWIKDFVETLENEEAKHNKKSNS